MTEFVNGLVKGAKETPRGFFAPAFALWRLLNGATDYLLHPEQSPATHKATTL